MSGGVARLDRSAARLPDLNREVAGGLGIDFQREREEFRGRVIYFDFRIIIGIELDIAGFAVAGIAGDRLILAVHGRIHAGRGDEAVDFRAINRVGDDTHITLLFGRIGLAVRLFPVVPIGDLVVAGGIIIRAVGGSPDIDRA